MAMGPQIVPPDPFFGTELPTETIFEKLPGESSRSSAPGELLNDYESRVRGMIDDAREFNAEVLMPRRITGQQLYAGMIPEIDAEGKSSIVKTEARDTILQMLPSVMRLFTAQDPPTNFHPTTEQSVPMAEQANDYVTYVLMHDNPGYMILQDVFKDAMIKAMGCVRWWTDEQSSPIEETYTGLSLEQRQFVVSQPGIEVVSMQVTPRPGPQGELIPYFDLTIRRVKRSRKHCIASVPPDEFRISRHAINVKTAALVGQERFATQTELLDMGVELADIVNNRDFSGGDLRFTEERMMRNPGSDSPFGRDAMEPVVRYGDYYMRIDKDGDGRAELRHICVIGDDALIVKDEPAARARYAICCCDPEPHSIVGHSIAEQVFDLQVIGSNLLRGSLDSLAGSIYPRIWGVDNLVNWDDVLNPAIGAPIRVKQGDAIGQFQQQFIGEGAFGMMEQLERVRMARTGVTPQSQGLDPKALQSSTPEGVSMVIQGATERIELVCRTMASTFMVDFMAGLLQEVTDNPIPDRVIQLRGAWVPVNPSQFDATMQCIPNPAMGHGSDQERAMLLNVIIAKQELAMSTMGPMNPMVTPIEYRNAFEDMLKIYGQRNLARYFKAITPESMQQFQQQLAAKEDPNMVLARAEADKVRAQVVDTLANARTKTADLELNDDRERDKNEGNQMLKAAEIDARYGAAVDTAAIRALWTAPRPMPGALGPDGEPGAPGMPGASPEAGLPPLTSPATGGGDRPKLPLRSALGHGPPQLPNGGADVGSPPAGLLGPP